MLKRVSKLYGGNRMLIKVNAQNGASGEPRRGWVLVGNTGNFIEFHNEGYDNGGEEMALLRKITPETLSINVTPREYKRLRGLRA